MESMETKVKKYITSLLTSTPLAMTIQQLSKDYKNTIGEPVPYQKLGYNSLEHLLRSISDTVQVMGTGPMAQVIPVVSEKSAHVNQLVTKQKVIMKSKRSNVQKRMTIFPPGYNHYPQKIENNPQLPPKKMYYPINKDNPPSKYPSQPVSTSTSNHQSNNSLKNNSCLSNNKNNLPSPVLQIDNDLLKKQQTVLESVKDSNRLEEKKISEEKPAHSSASGLCNVARWVQNTNSIVNDLDRVTTEQLESSVPILIRNNLRTLIKQCPEGIWCAEVPEKYRKMFRRELNYQELGFKSLIHLCVCLSSIFHYARPSTGDYKLYDRSRPLPDSAEKTYTMASYANKNNFETDPSGALPNLDWTDVKKFLPADIFMPGEEIPRAFVSHEVQENDEFDVVVGEIYDLSKFWVYMANSELDGLMDSIQEFYREHAEEYIIPDHLVREGIYCVQVIFGEYHRALIVDTMPELEETVRVIYIDYGTMAKVPSKGLCFLHTRFSKLEAQAVRCRLANVFPLEEGAPWTREASKAFRRLVANRDITAKISHINWDEQYLEVYLADVTDENGSFYINDKLVEEGFAQQPHKVRRQLDIDPIYTPIVKYLHLFPTFLELEHGLAPSTAEMEVFHECNIPINFLYPQYFYIDQSSEEAVIKAAEDFHEKYCLKEKRRTPASRYFDRDQFKPQEVDLSIFGELRSEIVKFLEKSVDEEETYSAEDFIDADEEKEIEEQESHSTDLNLLTEQLKESKLKEEEAVNVLKEDLMVTEDIMKNISNIYSFQSPNSISSRNSCLFDPRLNFGDKSELDSLKVGFQSNVTFPMVNDSNDSVDGFNSTVVKKEELSEFDDTGSHLELSNHPLSTIKFEDEENVSNGNWDRYSDHNYDLRLPDVHLDRIKVSLLPEDHPLSIISRLKSESEHKIQSFLDDELFTDPETNVDIETKTEPVTEENGDACTNPFLKQLDAATDLEIDVTKLNPNNPFLNFLQEDDKCSSGSSSSTVYDSPVVTQHSWTSFSDMSAETISQLGKSLRSSSSSGSSMVLSDDHRSCSTQTSDTLNKAVQVVESRSQFSYYYAPPYAYPPYPADFSGNPYYNVRFQGCMLESQVGPRPACPPGLPPPPGFLPHHRFPPARGFGPVPYGQRPMCFYPPQGMPGNVMPPRFPPAFNTLNVQSASGPTNGMSQPSSAPPSGAYHVGSNRDFYETYNEQLVRRVNHSGQ